jgi:putative nucleotidyltransferase with HDIG domain
MSLQRAKDLIRDNLSIPTLPEVVQRITAMIEDPQVGTAEIGGVVAEDAPLAAKVLRIANSAYYGLRERCLSAEQASAVLGVRVLKNVVTQAAVIQQFEHLREYPEFDIDELWGHSSMVAHACSILARSARGRIGLAPEEFHVCGLLHDLGKVVMLDSLGASYLDVFRDALRLDEPLHRHETQQLGFNHTDVGAIVAAHWSLPSAVAAAIQFHHGPREAVRDNPVVALVANANLICRRIAQGQLEAAEGTLDGQALDFLGIAPAEVPGIIAMVVGSQREEAA